jgi:hypothetical protein
MVKKIIDQSEYTATIDYYYSDTSWKAYSVYMKWDGCVEITKFYNGGADKEDEERLHICQIDDFIEELKAMEADRLALIKNAE